MSKIEESIDVQVPVSTAYNQWTQFEEFPTFMEGVKSVKQLDDVTLHWTAEVGGQERDWEAKITEQIPDERIAWTSTTGTGNAGVVTFHTIDPTTTRIMLQLEVYPQDWKEKVGDWLQIPRLRVKGDLKRFKGYIESRGTETGAWRGEVQTTTTR
jgi:uncharacterized membrane protein